jgi:hypothetical protein
MTLGGEDMKLLQISESKGYFLAESGEYVPVDSMRKEDLLRLAEITLTTESEMDEFDSALLQNQAHQIIYQNVWSKLGELAGRRAEFLDQSKRQFLTEYERYKSTAPQEATDSFVPPATE